MVLRLVVRQDWTHGRNGGLWDILECGHEAPYDGTKHTRRVCRVCDQVPPEQPELIGAVD